MRRRITVAIILFITIVLVSLGIASYYIIQRSIEDSLDERLAMATLIKDNTERLISANINRLYDISLVGSVDLDDGDFGPEREALGAAYKYSIFSDGIFLLDRGGNIILSYPERILDTNLNLLGIEPVARALATAKPVVSNIHTDVAMRKKAVYILVPVKDINNDYVGVVGGKIDPTNPALVQTIKSIDIGDKTFIDIIDSNGVVIASSKPSRILTNCDHDNFFKEIITSRKSIVTSCHQCHETGDISRRHSTMAAIVPLGIAPWSISIQEPEKHVFGPSDQLKKTFFALGIFFVGTSLILAMGISKSIVNPIKSLIGAAERISGGDLDHPVPVVYGSDEIGVLSRSLEAMRTKLSESLGNLRDYSEELEIHVAERTHEIQRARHRISVLLKQVISSLEDERKRIARGLHDDIVQDISALIMKVDMCRLYPEQTTPEKIGEVKDILDNVIDNIHTIIRDLRPTVLDDLGLDAAIKWLLEKHVAGKGSAYHLNIVDTLNRRFEPQVEIMLFRIIQESIVNISKHAHARNVHVSAEAVGDEVVVQIDDDGEGFDIDAIISDTSMNGQGLGILGMKERAALIDGKLSVISSVGRGTKVSIRLPAVPQRTSNG